MKKLRRLGIIMLLMLGALTACGGGTDGDGGGDGTGMDSNGDAQGVPGTVEPED